MAKGWVNPKWQSSRDRMDRRLEAAGLLNYQTKGMSQDQIAERYQSAGIRINSDTNWWKDNYADRPQRQSDLYSGMSTTPQGWGVQSGQQQTQTQPINAPVLPKPQTTGKGTGVFKPLPVNVTAPKIPAIGETINGITVTKDVQDQLIPQGQGAFGTTGQPIPPAQTDYTAKDFDWTKLTEAQKAQVLKDPKFSMSNVTAMGQQGLILSDGQFKLFNQKPTGDGTTRAPAYGGSYNPGLNPNGTGYGINGDLQWWQPMAYTALSNPKTTPIAQAAAMTLMTGGAGAPTAIGILGLSYIAQLKENENPILSGLGSLAEKGMYALNLGAQVTEQVAGTANYLSGGKMDENIKLKGAENLLPGLGAITGFVQTAKDILTGERLQEFISDPKLRDAVWGASQSYYETKGTQESFLNKVLETTIQDPTERADAARAINAFLPLVKDENQVWMLGEAEPVAVKPGYTLDDAVDKILNQGYTTEQVLSEYQQAYGLSGVASDFMLQSVFDPLNVADSGVSEGKAKLVEGQSQRIIDTGVMTPEQVARVEVNTIKADVYRESPSVNPLTEYLPWSETSRKLKASLQTAAQGNAEIAKVLTPWERKLAGLTPDGKIKELLPTDASKTGIPKFIDYVFNMTPDSKARLFLDRGASVLQSVFDFSKTADMTPRQMVDLLKASANADMGTLKNAGAEFLSAPEAYTIIGAARDFLPAMEKRAAAFDATAEQRARVTQALEALGDRNVLKNGLTQADWQRLQNNPGALVDSIKNGTVTFDSLKKDVAIFQPKKDGTPRVDLSLEEFQARTAAAFDDHVLNWGKDYFGIQKAGQFEEALKALKGLQSLMLLDISPTSIMNDIINERVMIATRGTLGLTDSGIISKFMDDMGVVNKGDGSAGGLGDAVKTGDPISQLTRAEGGIFTKAADAIQQVRSKLPRSKITGATNEAHQLQIRYSEMKKYMTRNWQEGKGFDRMPPSLEAKLREYGYDPQLVYQNLRSTFKPDQIDLLKDRATNMDVNTFIDQAATKLGKDPQAARETLEQLGALDQLKDGLEKAQTMEQRAQVFDRVSETVVNSIDIRLASQLKGMLENVRNKIKAEGPAGVMQVFQEIPLDYFERKIENDNIWDEAFAKAAEVDDYTVKNTIKNKAANDNRAAWRRTQARQAALYMAALEGLDLSREFGRDFMTKLGDEQKILQKFFEEKNAKAQQLATKSYKTPDAAAAAWDGFFTQFNERFAADQKKVLDIQKQRNALFAKEMGRMYGQKAEASAAAWMDGVMNNSETMHQNIVEFRKGLQGLPADARAEAWKQFKPEYQAQWRERMKVDMQGAGNLYKWDENPPYIADYIDRANVDMEAALKADAERRDAVWQIADEFGYKQDTRDKFKLEGGLRKVEYGGIPDLKGINDPRLTPEKMREILTKRAEVKAAEAAMQPELPTQPIVAADAVTGNAPKIGENTNILKAIEQLGGITKDQARDILGEAKTKGKVFTDTGRGIDEVARLLADEGYPIDLNRPDDIGGIQQATEMIQRAQAGEDVYPMGHSFDRAIDREAKAYYEDQRAQEIARYTNEVDALRNEVDAFDRAAPDAEQRAIALLERQIELYNSPESLWDTPHNDGTLFDGIQKLNEEINQLVDEASNFERILDNAFEAQENIRTMETHADGLTKREQVQEQLRNTFGEEQGAAVFELADLRAQRWAEMTGRTPEEWYASRVQSVNKGGDTPTLAQSTPDGVMAKGGVDFDQYGRATITAMKSADVSTGVHEFAHVFLEDFRRMVDEALPEHAVTIKQDLNTLKNWSSVKQDGNTWRATNAREFTITEEGGKFLYHDPSMPKPMAFDNFEQAQARLEHELFARGFEKYMRDGKAPTRALGALFARFADWMREIYRSLTGKAVNVDISPPMRDFFNRLLTDYERVDYDTNAFYTDAEGRLKPRDTAYGLEQIDRNQATQLAQELASPDLMARAQAERARMQGEQKLTVPEKYLQKLGKNEWELTRNEFAEYRSKFVSGQSAGSAKKTARLFYSDQVASWVRDGKPVPDYILNEFPELKAKAEPPLLQAEPPVYSWQMTRQQYDAAVNFDGKFLDSDLEMGHRIAVEQAYRAGRDVPEEVLQRYDYLLNPEKNRYDTTDAQARREQMRQQKAEQYYKDKLYRQQNQVFYQQGADQSYVRADLYQVERVRKEYAQKENHPEWIDEAINKFGITKDPKEAGYILPDGKLLDLSGKNEGGTAGTRSLDHRDIGRILPKEYSGDTATSYLLTFASQTGSLRMSDLGDQLYLDIIGTVPTDAQIRSMKSIAKGYDQLTVDITDVRGNTVLSADFSAKPSSIDRLTNDARNIFEGAEDGQVLENKYTSNTRFYQQEADTMPTLPPGGYDQLSGYMDVGKMLYDGWLDEVKPMLDEMKNSAMQPENRYNFAGMDEQTRKQMNLYLADTRGKLATSKNAARRWGDEMVDFTILDYRRQYGFDKLFSSVVPYEFYGTRSALNWATRVMDRPAYLSHFARLQQLHETYESQLPERTRGKVFLPMPFLPEWAGGGTFVDPKFALFPWTQFLQPLDAIKRQNETLNNNASYILRDWSESGQVSQEEAAQAMSSRSGATWEKAIEQAKIDQGENLNTGADYFSMLFGPALYLTVPYYLATGEKFAGINSSYPSGQLPITRVGQALETAFKDTPMEWIGNAAGLLAKPEAMAREAMGLPEFGEWGDYYIDRQLANMAAEGTATPEQIQMAMIERKGELYDKAEQRVREELMLRIPGMAPLYGLAHGASFDKVVGSLIPSLFPGGLVPPAEMEYKGLKNEYNQAWKQYEAGNKDAISTFFDEHPEYQARLALRRDPQERIEQFLKSQIWDVYGQLETTDRKSATAQMEGFAEFLDAEPGQSFSVEQLAQWAQQLGALIPQVEQTMPAFENPAPRINYFAPEITKVTDQFFEERKTLHPDYWKYQNEYYALATKAEKRTYLMSHPQLGAYWDWKDKWYNRYPDYVPVFNGEVFKNVDTRDYPPMLVQMIQMYALTGEEIPTATRPLLEMAWIEAGRPYDNLDTWIDKDLIPSVRNDMMQGMAQ